METTCSTSHSMYTQYAAAAAAAAAAAKSLQSCPTLCNSTDGSPPGSPLPGILQARTLERVASSFSNAWKWKGKVKSHSRVRLLATPWTAAYQAPLSMGFSRQEYWSGLPSPYTQYMFAQLKCFSVLRVLRVCRLHSFLCPYIPLTKASLIQTQPQKRKASAKSSLQTTKPLCNNSGS